MSIGISDDGKLFTIDTENTSYQMKVTSQGHLIHTHYGRRIYGDASINLERKDRGFSQNPTPEKKLRDYSIDYLPLELSGFGSGDYRTSAVTIMNGDGSTCFNPVFEGYELKKGKYSIEGLPTFATDNAETLVITLVDKASQVRARLFYSFLQEKDIITRALEIENDGDKDIRILKAMSTSFDIAYGDYDLISFPGRHCYERVENREHVSWGCKRLGSTRGYSSHQMNPAFILAERNTDEENGEAIACALVYSGSFVAEVEKSQYGSFRVQIGINDEAFSYPLAPGECFRGPEAILSFSAEGLDRLSYNLHMAARENLIREIPDRKHRPVLINSWEGCYFDFSAQNIIDLARDAKTLGADMVVMDDGWFGKRDDDFSGLGDWYVNEKKLKMTLGEMVERINKEGIRFGIWFEPEMVCEDSDLYRAHPDWALTVPGRTPSYGRSQLVLDFSRKEVRDNIFEQMSRIMDSANIEYIKWDANRHISEFFSRGAEDQGTTGYRYMLGLYEFLEKFKNRYPGVILEGCSGGGGRFDYGMLHYFPFIWTSDNTDPIDRLSIQRGTSFFYPPETMGCHVSASPNHQDGRETPFFTRCATALTGTFGYELVPSRLSDEERSIMKWANEYNRSNWEIISKGRYHRLSDPEQDDYYAWMIVANDGSKAILHTVSKTNHGNNRSVSIRLRGLDEKAWYRIGENVVSGSVLMYSGMLIPDRKGCYEAGIFIIEKVE